MSERYWKGPLAFLALGIVALLVTRWASWHVSSDLTDERVRGERTAEYHDQYAVDAIDEKCLSFDAMALRDCIHEQIDAARDHERAEQDLDAQQVMARFTKIMGWAAMGGLVLGFASAVWIYQTLTATRKMANDTRDIGEKQVRAYISVESIGFSKELSTNGGLVANMTYKNSGQSPAINVRHELQSLYVETSPKTPIYHSDVTFPPVLEGAESAAETIASGGISSTCFAFSPPVPKTAMQDISNGVAFAVVRGWIKYDDVFGAPHETHFCWVKDKDALRQGFDIRLTPYGNSAD